MTTSPNKMSDEDLREAIIGIVEAEYKSPNYTPAVERVDRIMQLIKQHREAYALEENKNGFFAACGVCGVENTEKAEEYYRIYRSKLREKGITI